MYFENEEDRKDLFQEMIIHLWKSYDSFRGESKFSSWMYRVCLNVALQHFKKSKNKLENAGIDDAINIVALKPDVSTEKEAILYQAIGKLNPVEKAIMLLHLEEKSNEEIADIVGITQNNVRVRMNRIRNKLKTILKSMLDGN